MPDWRQDRIAEYTLDTISEYMSDRMLDLENMSDRMSECMEYMSKYTFWPCYGGDHTK